MSTEKAPALCASCELAVAPQRRAVSALVAVATAIAAMEEAEKAMEDVLLRFDQMRISGNPVHDEVTQKIAAAKGGVMGLRLAMMGRADALFR